MLNEYIKGFIVSLFLGFLILSPNDAVASTNAVETAVREYFKDIPVMIEIARCESEFRQYKADGTALYGGWSDNMIGVFQFFNVIHQGPAELLGFNLATLDGNMAYARYLHAQSGTTPWNSSKSCWDVPLPQTITIPNETNTSALQMKREILIKIIARLQELILEKQKSNLTT